MKKILLFTVCLLAVMSCSSSQFLTGKYETTSHTVVANKSYEHIWSNIVDWFFDTQTTISLIDKNSGIITSGKVNLSMSMTDEWEGAPKSKTKYIVIPNGISSYSVSASGRVMARIKDIGGKTQIQVILGDIDCRYNNSFIEAKSTGVFEQNWLKYISNK